jgi:hypothetical protein
LLESVPPGVITGIVRGSCAAWQAAAANVLFVIGVSPENNPALPF